MISLVRFPQEIQVLPSQPKTVYGILKFMIYLSVVFIVLTVILSQLFAPSAYSWTQNTISELSSQGVQNQWIMQVGFICFGLILTSGLVWKAFSAGKVIWPDIPLIGYAFSILITGFFSARPYLTNVEYNIQEASIHSTFATFAGLLLALSLVLSIFLTGNPKEKLFHTIFLILIVGASAAFGLAESGTIPIGKGVMQRLLWLVSFIWLIVGQQINLDQ